MLVKVSTPLMSDREELLKKALTAKRESKYVEFKEQFDVDSAQAWCEIIKDIIAIANSGGGVVVVGLTSGGRPSEHDVSALVSVDPATITDKVSAYTGRQFTEFEVASCDKDGHDLVAILVSPAATPFVFERPGTYAISDKKQKTAFGRGTVYFRHGAKSEPATSEDLRQVIERRLEEIREDWIGGVRKVVRAPEGSAVQIVPPEIVHSTDPGAVAIRIVDDPQAPPYRVVDPDETHPYRQKELIKEVNKRLPTDDRINSYDVLVVRRIYGIDGHEAFCHCPKYGSPQYSDVFVEWLIDQYKKDASFFRNARIKYYQGAG